MAFVSKPNSMKNKQGYRDHERIGQHWVQLRSFNTLQQGKARNVVLKRPSDTRVHNKSFAQKFVMVEH